MNTKQEYLSYILKESEVFSNRIFTIIDIPDRILDYFFIKFYNKDTIEKNQENLKFWHFSLRPIFINICIFFSHQSDLRRIIHEHLPKNSSEFHIDIEDLFPNYDIDFLLPDIHLDEILHNWNPKSVHLYHDVTSFISRNMRNIHIPYQTALGLWVVYNLCEDKPNNSDIDIAPLLGSFLITSTQMHMITKQILKKK
ncbi:MAG: hypothetical protein ACOYXB_11395 [Bacteroidota bacterium]